MDDTASFMPQTDAPHTLVIGSGFGGIASALRMRALGHKVTLVERLDAIGGRAQSFEHEGFRHDAGPTVITAPFLFDELFALFGERRESYLDFRPLDPWYRFQFQDGQSFDYRPELADTHAEIAKFSPEDIENYNQLVETSRQIFDIGFSRLAEKPFTRFTSMIAQIPHLLRLKSYKTVAQLVNSHIKHPLLRQALSIHPLLVGGNPFSTTSIYALIHYLERKWGVFFCMGGTGKLVYELEQLMRRQHITIRLNTYVEEILVSEGRVTGIRTAGGEIITADRVICNGDPPTIYREMLPSQKTKRKKALPESMTKYSMGLFVLFFGTTRQYQEIAHHTIWMGKRYQELLDDIFNKQILTEDFSLYLHRPTATDARFAPGGCDSFYVLCRVPNLQGEVDWQKEGPALQNRIVTALEKTIMPELSRHMTADFYMTPVDFKDRYRSTHGAGFSISPHFTQSAWFRYHNRDPHLDNLYFSGAGTHPGAGMPGVLCSAKVVETLVREDSKLDVASMKSAIVS